MVPPNLELPVNRFAFPCARLALVSALLAAFGLAGCGRKGPLDPPPAASVVSQPQGSAAGPIGAQSRPDNPGVDKDGKPVAPAGPQKRIPLDVLLN